MEHLIFASYGNDSIALIQWAYERGLKDVHVAYGDTGWAAEWWPARVEQAEAWVRTLGFVPHRIKGEAMGALVMREQAWNRKNSVRVVVNGRNLRVPELSADTGIPETTLYRWLRSGVDIDHLISQRAAKPGASIRHQQSAG